MKKIVSFAIVFCILLTTFGCGDKPAVEEQTTEPIFEEEPTTEEQTTEPSSTEGRLAQDYLSGEWDGEMIRIEDKIYSINDKGELVDTLNDDLVNLYTDHVLIHPDVPSGYRISGRVSTKIEDGGVVVLSNDRTELAYFKKGEMISNHPAPKTLKYSEKYVFAKIYSVGNIIALSYGSYLWVYSLPSWDPVLKSEEEHVVDVADYNNEPFSNICIKDAIVFSDISGDNFAIDKEGNLEKLSSHYYRLPINNPDRTDYVWAESVDDEKTDQRMVYRLKDNQDGKTYTLSFYTYGSAVKDEDWFEDHIVSKKVLDAETNEHGCFFIEEDKPDKPYKVWFTQRTGNEQKETCLFSGSAWRLITTVIYKKIEVVIYTSEAEANDHLISGYKNVYRPVFDGEIS